MQEILDLVAAQLGAAEVRPESRLIEDLGAESADLLNLVVAVEDRFGIRIDEEEIPDLRTPADLERLVRSRLPRGI